MKKLMRLDWEGVRAKLSALKQVLKHAMVHNRAVNEKIASQYSKSSRKACSKAPDYHLTSELAHRKSKHHFKSTIQWWIRHRFKLDFSNWSFSIWHLKDFNYQDSNRWLHKRHLLIAEWMEAKHIFNPMRKWAYLANSLRVPCYNPR